jgi:16S rRNA (cytidine1402-2'-O)-methyltransferase
VAQPAGTLYVVATPLGHLEDVTLRALAVLRSVGLVACEDTRRTRRLLVRHGISARTVSCHEHNEGARAEELLAVLRQGSDVALVSDAGTPGISDPGQHLVRRARDEGLRVLPVPGPSAGVAALSVSGLGADRFLFVGFLPARSAARHRALEELRDVRVALVLYEAPTRLRRTLADLRRVLGDREAFLCREATKVHEEYVRGTLGGIEALLASRAEVRGEVTLVVAAPKPRADPGAASPVDVVRGLLAAGVPRREAVKRAARMTGRPAREIYRAVLEDDASSGGG